MKKESKKNEKRIEETLKKILGANEESPFLKNEERVIDVPLDKLCINRDQPRLHFDEDSLVELARSIDHRGLLAPIIVREIEPSRYEIVVGERRVRAFKILGRTLIPAIVRGDIKDEDLGVIALAENFHRQDLTVVEKAIAIVSIKNSYGKTREAADEIGVNQKTIERYSRMGDAMKNQKVKEIFIQYAAQIDIRTATALCAIAEYECEDDSEIYEVLMEKIKQSGIKRGVREVANSIKKVGRISHRFKYKESETQYILICPKETGKIPVKEKEELKKILENMLQRLMVNELA